MPLNRQVLLTQRPAGIPQAGDFSIVETAIPATGDGEFLVRNLYLSVDPAQRGWASAEANYSAPIPLGSVMRALAVGEVVESRAPDVAVGDHLYGWFSWQDYAVAAPTAILRRVDPATAPLSTALGVLGLNGLTAFLALEKLGRPRAGETILVSTAAGGVGSVVGQLARAQGLHTIGLTSDARKIALCRDAFGYAHAINYRDAANLGAAIAEAAPGGIDVFFDNTAGAIADTVFPLMNVAGRIVQCGTASVASWIPLPNGPRRERMVLMKRLAWQGFVAFDHMADFDRAAAELGQHLAAGRMNYREEILEGIEQAPGAIALLYDGANLGRIIIKP